MLQFLKIEYIYNITRIKKKTYRKLMYKITFLIKINKKL